MMTGGETNEIHVVPRAEDRLMIDIMGITGDHTGLPEIVVDINRTIGMIVEKTVEVIDATTQDGRKDGDADNSCT